MTEKTETTKYPNLKSFDSYELSDIKIAWYKKFYYNICNGLDSIKDIPRKIKWFVQRGIRGWADCDTWSLDYYLARVIKDSTSHLSKNSHGWPSHAFSTMDDWKKMLKKISRTYSRYIYFCDDDHNYMGKYIDKFGKKKGLKLYDKRWKLVKKDMQLLIKYFGHLWD